MSTHNLILYDRSRVTCDWTCSRKRYWNYEHGGRGVSPSTTSLPLHLGICLHDGLAAIATRQADINSGGGSDSWIDIDEVAGVASKSMFTSLMEGGMGLEEEAQFAHEQASLVEGLLRGFYKHAWPRLIEAYPNILFVEEEMRYDHDGLTFMSRPDLVVADREGSAAYVEYKSTSSKKEDWINSWSTAVQLHSTCRAVKATKGIDVERVIVQGLYKGYISYGKQSSPLCYAYKRAAQPPFVREEISYAYKPGLKRYPTWELPGGVKAWVEGMDEETLSEQFPQAPPIYINEDLVDAFFSQRSVREREIHLALEMMDGVEDDGVREAILNTAFDQRFDQCRPAWGSRCDFLRLCHGPKVDPLTSGFDWRESHHDLELEQDAKASE